MKTIINIFGAVYYLWIKGAPSKDTGEYQDWFTAWENNELLSLAFHITEEDDKNAPRVAFDDGQLFLVPSDEKGSVFGYIWCSKEGMLPRGNFEHGLVGMRYGWEKAKDTVFFDASSAEFQWRLAVSKRVYSWMQWKQKQMKAPAPLAEQKLDEKPELFKTKINKLTFREKLQRYLRKPTTKVYEAIMKEFLSFPDKRQEEIVNKLAGTQALDAPHLAEVYSEMRASLSKNKLRFRRLEEFSVRSRKTLETLNNWIPFAMLDITIFDWAEDGMKAKKIKKNDYNQLIKEAKDLGFVPVEFTVTEELPAGL